MAASSAKAINAYALRSGPNRACRKSSWLAATACSSFSYMANCLTKCTIAGRSRSVAGSILSVTSPIVSLPGRDCFTSAMPRRHAAFHPSTVVPCQFRGVSQVRGTMNPRTPRCLFLIALLLLNFPGLPAWGQTPTSLQIVIVEGEGAINNVKQRVNREPIVQVEDENHKPVAGAAVIFFLPNQGPGGTFANGSTSLTTTTNAQGQAVARGIRFNNQAGAMEIRVAASFAGQT